MFDAARATLIAVSAPVEVEIARTHSGAASEDAAAQENAQ